MSLEKLTKFILTINKLKNKTLRIFIKKNIEYIFIRKCLKKEINNLTNITLKPKNTHIIINYNELINNGCIYKKYKNNKKIYKMLKLDFISFKYIKDFFFYNIFFLSKNNLIKYKIHKLNHYVKKIKKKIKYKKIKIRKKHEKYIKKRIELNYKLFI
jgi:hypothetical protein